MALGHPDGWGYMGLNGYYNQAPNQQQLQNSAYQNAIGNLSGPYYNGGLAQQSMMNPYLQAQNVVVSSSTDIGSIGSLFQNYVPPKVKAKAKRLIDRLRSEIEEWHGDVLMRRAYA